MNKRGLYGVFAFMFLLLPLLLFSCKKTDEKTVVVDMKERSQTAADNSSGETQAVRIAIAAVVSPRETAVYYDQMMKYVGKRLGRNVELVQRKTYQEINDMLERRELDLAFVCAGPYVNGHKKFGMELLVAPMLYGKPFYQAYFIVHKDNPINDIGGLRGKRFAFTDPDSNTGKLVPTYILAKMGETPEQFFKEVIFTYSHDNSIKAVSKGLVDGASVDGLIWEYFNDKTPERVRDTKIIYKSPLFGIPPVVVHPKTSAAVKEGLKKIFLGMHDDPEGRKILSEIRVEKFIVPIDSSYDSVRQMQAWLEKRK
ncbi:MAG: phosphate/phosphite/phosphonate ABC transporter substrate-binding protein [Nitrospirota bacterium]